MQVNYYNDVSDYFDVLTIRGLESRFVSWATLYTASLSLGKLFSAESAKTEVVCVSLLATLLSKIDIFISNHLLMKRHVYYQVSQIVSV
jgi:hypothetical protein